MGLILFILATFIIGPRIIVILQEGWAIFAIIISINLIIMGVYFDAEDNIANAKQS
jgi:hypothetical protein